MSSFNREVSGEVIDSVKESVLYRGKILPDLHHGAKNQLRIFPALRPQIIDFYYGGGRIYRYDKNGFSTHVKYGAVAVSGPSGEYFREDDYGAVKWPCSFKQAHERIKENCRLYSGLEAEGISRIYSKHSFVAPEEDYMVLDVEIAFSSKDELADETGRPVKLQSQKKTNRIDLLLYRMEDRRLHFIEAKHHSNPEIRAKESPKVIGQLDGYNAVLAQQDQQRTILEQYGRYIEQVNQLFDLSLPQPKRVEDHVKLLIFGMDRLQLREFRTTYEDAYRAHPVYHFQKPGSIILKHLWNKLLWK